MRALIAIVSLCVLIGCDGAHGVVFRNGRLEANTAENQRDQICALLAGQIERDLGPHWRASVAIAELPEYEQDDRDLDAEWYWKKATVIVALIGDGQAELAKSEADVTAGVTSYMKRRVQRRKDALTVTTTSAQDPQKFAALAQAQDTPPAGEKSATANRAYTIQSGDTLADISIAFYGTPQRWRQIAAANPGLEADKLKPGDVIVIPPK